MEMAAQAEIACVTSKSVARTQAQRECMSERVCGIRMRGRAKLKGKQVPQNESLKGFEPPIWLRYQVLELKEVCLCLVLEVARF